MRQKKTNLSPHTKASHYSLTLDDQNSRGFRKRSTLNRRKKFKGGKDVIFSLVNEKIFGKVICESPFSNETYLSLSPLSYPTLYLDLLV